jgi:hypothetical protein
MSTRKFPGGCAVWRGRLLKIVVCKNGHTHYTARTRDGQLFHFTGDTAMRQNISNSDIGRWFTLDLRK